MLLSQLVFSLSFAQGTCPQVMWMRQTDIAKAIIQKLDSDSQVHLQLFNTTSGILTPWIRMMIFVYTCIYKYMLYNLYILVYTSSRMPASIELSIKLVVCLYIRVYTRIYQKHVVYTSIYIYLPWKLFSYRDIVSWCFSIIWYIYNAVYYILYGIKWKNTV
jgi:hypothetical protein